MVIPVTKVDEYTFKWIISKDHDLGKSLRDLIVLQTKLKVNHEVNVFDADPFRFHVVWAPEPVLECWSASPEAGRQGVIDHGHLDTPRPQVPAIHCVKNRGCHCRIEAG